MITLDTTYFYAALVLLPLAGMLLATCWVNIKNTLVPKPMIITCNKAFYQQLDLVEDVLSQLNNMAINEKPINYDQLAQVSKETLQVIRIVRSYLIATGQLMSSATATEFHKQYARENPRGK